MLALCKTQCKSQFFKNLPLSLSRVFFVFLFFCFLFFCFLFFVFLFFFLSHSLTLSLSRSATLFAMGMQSVLDYSQEPGNLDAELGTGLLANRAASQPARQPAGQATTLPCSQPPARQPAGQAASRPGRQPDQPGSWAATQADSHPTPPTPIE